MTKEEFAGDKKVGGSLLYDLENRIVKKYIDKVPLWLETYHLTLMTIIWSALILLFSYLAKDCLHWLWLVSLMIFFQYGTDLFDGKVGKYRNTGLIKWGYFMDHFLDYIFMCSILIGYAFLLPDKHVPHMIFILAIFGAFMVNSYLSFAATNEFRIAFMRIGPTEVRFLLILANTTIIIFGVNYMVQALPFVLAFSCAGLCFVVYKTQKYIWQIDMGKKGDQKVHPNVPKVEGAASPKRQG